MNTPTPYILPADASVFYIYGRSAHGAAHDVHLPLVHEPGEQVTRPLSFATDAKRKDVERATALLQHAEFVFARTMADNPHFYTPRKTWANDADFLFAASAIRLYGHREKYVPPGAVKAAYSETVFAAGEHFYWSGYLPVASVHWINRKPLASTATPEVVDQILRVENARLLEVPELPDGWQGLPRSVTCCASFRFGVSVFGWPAPRDLRPRLVRQRRRA
jgi:hypothetical protein